MLATAGPALWFGRIWALPVFVWDGLSGREAVSALDVELDSPLAFPGGAADEVSRLEFDVGGELEVAEPVVPPDDAVCDGGQVEVLDFPGGVVAPG